MTILSVTTGTNPCSTRRVERSATRSSPINVGPVCRQRLKIAQHNKRDVCRFDSKCSLCAISNLNMILNHNVDIPGRQ
jgi:hypothetical protein